MFPCTRSCRRSRTRAGWRLSASCCKPGALLACNEVRLDICKATRSHQFEVLRAAGSSTPKPKARSASTLAVAGGVEPAFPRTAEARRRFERELILDMTKAAYDLLARVRQQKPVVHHLTNWVTIYDCAQIVKSIGGSPVMAHAPEEVADMVRIASALVLNIGTLTGDLVEAMKLAARAANAKGIPVVLECAAQAPPPSATRKRKSCWMPPASASSRETLRKSPGGHRRPNQGCGCDRGGLATCWRWPSRFPGNAMPSLSLPERKEPGNRLQEGLPR